MSTKAARREYLQAVAEFQLGVQKFAAGMERILDLPTPEDGQETVLTQLLGPRKPARRAPRSARSVERAKKA